MNYLEKRVTVVCGHYGVGKTNLSINLALDCAEQGQRVTLIDMDVVNPYFRSSDYSDVLTARGVRVLGPNFANSNLDTPSLPAAIGDAISEGEKVIVDVGGDDAGATALGVYRKHLGEADPDVLYVVNRYRSQTTVPEEAVQILSEIEKAAQAYIDNNSEEVRAKIGASKEDVMELMELQTVRSLLLDPLA
jgi:CO dehydrogenase nickel-insertion accessory protein CooC1